MCKLWLILTNAIVDSIEDFLLFVRLYSYGIKSLANATIGANKAFSVGS